MKILSILTFLKEKQIPFTFTGNELSEVYGFSSLSQYKSGSFTWVKKQKNIPTGFNLTNIKLAFISEDVVGTFENVIRTPESKYAFFSTIEHFYAQEEKCPVTGEFSYISPKVNRGKNVRIGHNCILDGDISIGDNTIIWNNVTIINKVIIGKRSVIQSGVVIGHDDLAYTEQNGFKTMVKHYGGVCIGDDVTIGADTVINRGTVDNTTIGNNCIIDALCQISHNVIMGNGVTLISGTLLYGSVHIGNNAYITSAIVRNQCVIGENAFVGMGSVVLKDVPANVTVIGNPAKLFIKNKPNQ